MNHAHTMFVDTYSRYCPPPPSPLPMTCKFNQSCASYFSFFPFSFFSALRNLLLLRYTCSPRLACMRCKELFCLTAIFSVFIHNYSDAIFDTFLNLTTGLVCMIIHEQRFLEQCQLAFMSCITPWIVVQRV